MNYNTTQIVEIVEKQYFNDRLVDLFLVTVPDSYIIYSQNEPSVAVQSTLVDYLFPVATSDPTER